jgi:type I restriction enzyme S subunit
MVYNSELKREIPEGWEVKEISNFGHIQTGKTPSFKFPEHFGKSVPFYTPVDFNSNQKLKISSERGLSNGGKIAMTNYIIPKNSIMITCIGSDMGKASICFEEGITNQQLNSIIPFNLNHSDYIYQSIFSILPHLKMIGKSGSTVPIVNKSTLGGLKLIKPLNSILEKYSNSVEKLNLKIVNNLKQNQELSSLRDWLLPMLMNGQVTVKGAYEKMEEVEVGMAAEGEGDYK